MKADGDGHGEKWETRSGQGGEAVSAVDVSEWGTFKDSLRAPIHGWFAYPAGFSWKAVRHSFQQHDIRPGMLVYDPFAGTGTVPLTAKQFGIEAVGAEPHPFVCKIANVKFQWGAREHEIRRAANMVVSCAQKKSHQTSEASLHANLPPLVLKCYETQTLIDLVALRDVLCLNNCKSGKSFLKLALTGILRPMSIADTGWPYISFKKIRKNPNRGSTVADAFLSRVDKMLEDVSTVKKCFPDGIKTRVKVYCRDSRESNFIAGESVDHIFTSPPYLNNIDYADRTRLEMFFWGMASSWGDLTRSVRNHLMVAATTQISGRKNGRYALSAALRHDCPEVAARLDENMAALSDLRGQRAGKKDYDCVVGGYFSDIHLVLKNCYHALKSGGCAVFILGDSAPYGVHIPTDMLIGEIGCAVGFAEYEVTVLRERGGRWKSSPHTHGVPLRESVVTLWKT